MNPIDAIDFYDRNAEALAASYDALDASALLGPLAEDLDISRGLLDVGAGSGRDARHFARLGARVTAVEPSSLRVLAQREHHPNVTWIDDRLPDLASVRGSFGAITCLAVWHHLEPALRPAALRRLADLLLPGGRILVSLRIGPPAPGRPSWPVSHEELAAIGGPLGLFSMRAPRAEDALRREDIRWENHFLQKTA